MENTMATQTALQITAAWEGAKQALLPAVVSDLQVNADYIKHRMGSLKLDWTAENIVAVVLALNVEGKILWDTPPVEKSARQKAIEDANKQEARMRRDAADANSLKQRDVTQVQKNNATDAQDRQKIADEKELKSLRSQIYQKIDGYSVGHQSGGRDFSRGESGQKTLRGVLVAKVGGHITEGLDKLVLRATTVQAAKEALQAVEKAWWKLQ
jgi:hypothetical protein